MHIRLTFSFVALLAAAPAFGQVVPATSNLYGLDPYNPTDAAWLRNYGAALVAQAPIAELAALDPYRPSEAALVRQAGGAIPLCCLEWGWAGPLTVQGLPLRLRARGPAPAQLDVNIVSMPTADAPPVSAASPAAQGPTVAATYLRPATNDGIWIRYAGRTWISAGRAVPLQEAERLRVGEHAGRPVYRLVRGNDDVIYLPVREGVFAPFRPKP
jgi:hypothetical protein